MTPHLLPPLHPHHPAHPPLTMLAWQMWLSFASYWSCKAALPHAKPDCINWNPALRAQAKQLEAQLQHYPAAAVEHALLTHHLREQHQFTQGLQRYVSLNQQTTAQTYSSPHRTLWQSGTCRLLRFGNQPETEPPLVLIPSLLNRPYILDLTPQRSLIAQLLPHRNVYLLDWGDPEPHQRDWQSEQYILHCLLPALHLLQNHCPKGVHLLGHCMGGMFALAALQQTAAPLSGILSLILLSTPWDFTSIAPTIRHWPKPVLQQWLQRLCPESHRLSSHFLQPLFYARDPFLFGRKYRQFSQFPPNSSAENHFVALERWVNDAGYLTPAVAEEAFIHWAQENQPKQAQWKVNGASVCPEQLPLPILMLQGRKDAVVPPASSLALLPHLKRGHSQFLPGGHAGLLVGREGLPHLTSSLHQWFATQQAA